LTGVFVGVITVNYEAASVLLAFGATFLTFIALSAYGYFTKQDLTKWGSIALMGLFGAIIVSVFNVLLFFIAPQLSNAIYWIVNYVVLALFVVLIAYDTQKLKALAIEAEQRGGSVASYAIQGALMLYLDFINLFLRILSIMGKRR
jgi:FtsH-binding integral membrane protein